MKVLRRIPHFAGDLDVTLVVRSGAEHRVHGKFVSGPHLTERNHLMVVCDDGLQYHSDIAIAYGVRPQGGGWLEIDHQTKRFRVYGRSDQFGREPVRTLTADVVGAVFAGYSRTVEE
jgi:hypothetical protein